MDARTRRSIALDIRAMVKAAHEHGIRETDWNDPDALDRARAKEQGYLMGLLSGYISLLEIEAEAQDAGLEETELTPSP